MQRYFNNVANQRGAAIAGASVLVKNFSDLTTATVYSTNSAIAGNVKTNPLTSDSDGGFFFYAADGRYSLIIVPSGGSTSTLSDVLLEDPSDSTVPVALVASTATWAIAAGAASTATTALTASTATAAITASTATSVKGTIAADDAAAGFVGEYISQQTTGLAVALGNGTAANISTATLTPGDYEAWGQTDFTPAASSGVTMLQVGINTTSASIAGQDTYARQLSAIFTPGSSIMTLAAPLQRITVSSGGTATLFLVAVSSFATSTMSGDGVLNVRRRR